MMNRIICSSSWKITIALKYICFHMSEDNKPYQTVKNVFGSYFPNTGGDITVFQKVAPLLNLSEIEIHAHPASLLKVR